MKVAFLGFDHTHVNLMFYSFYYSDLDVEYVGIADFLEADREAALMKASKNVSKDLIETVPFYDDYNEMLDKKPDIVIINSDVRSHADCVEAVLAKGLNAVVEKPMAFDMEDAKRMYHAAQKSSGELLINWPIAWFPAFNKAKKLADSGVIGEVLRVQYRSPATFGPYPPGFRSNEEMAETWWFRQDRGGGAIMDYACYGFVIATWITKLCAKSVSGLKKQWFSTFSDVEDYSIFAVDFGNKIGLAEGSWSTVNNGGVPTGPVIYGKKGVITVDRYDSVVKVYTDTNPYSASSEPPQTHDTPDEDNCDMARALADHFVYGKPIHEMLTLDFNMKAMAALDAGIRACESNKTENVIDPFGL